MEYISSFEVEIDAEKMEDVSGISLKQEFNDHHIFSVRIDYDVIEGDNKTLSITKAQKKIGKTIIIRFSKSIGNSNEVVYEFKGLICEVRLEQSNNMNAELVYSGYSPTILLESGPDLTSFNEVNVQSIVTKVTKSLGSACNVINRPKFSDKIPYICQYRETAFNFLNRLSSELGEYFYYDGKDIYFGKPSSQKKLVITNGEDVTSMQLSVKALPVNLSSYSYKEKDEQFFSAKSPGSQEGLGQYSSHAFKESKNIFSAYSKEPSGIHAENSSDLSSYIKIKQAAIAANMEMLTATSYNPSICIGSVVSLKVSSWNNGSFSKSDYGDFVVVSIEHSTAGSGGYYNNFVAVPSSLDVIPVSNYTIPVAETQIATVTDNEDVDTMGRVKVQMLWQKEDNVQTDWIRVMTPDAGKGKDGKNRGLVCIPEIGDQVIVGFRYNDPDRPFVMGSVFTGKTGQGGGNKNLVKSYTTNTGSTIKFEEDKISIIDAKKKSKILFDGEGKINVESEEEITLKCGQSSITMKKDGTIDIKGKDITLAATSKASVKANSGIEVKCGGGDVKIEGVNAEMSGQAGVRVKGTGTAELSASGQTTVKGGIVMIN